VNVGRSSAGTTHAAHRVDVASICTDVPGDFVPVTSTSPVGENAPVAGVVIARGASVGGEVFSSGVEGPGDGVGSPAANAAVVPDTARPAASPPAIMLTVSAMMTSLAVRDACEACHRAACRADLADEALRTATTDGPISSITRENRGRVNRSRVFCGVSQVRRRPVLRRRSDIVEQRKDVNVDISHGRRTGLAGTGLRPGDRVARDGCGHR